MLYLPTIGLEIHIELKTKTKMFCGCLNDSEERHPNVNVCPICLAHPGVLPVINQEAVGAVLKLGFALNADIAQVSKFDRKNYFYPDLPKGYQISQYDQPLVSGGYLEIYLAEKSNVNDLPATKKIRLRRVHLEEDAGRLNHSDDGKNTYVDFNRAGVPLAELVTEPDIASALEVRRFAEELRAILRYLDIANADMEKGEMRCEVNISLAKEGSEELGTKVEIKNLNSFRAVEQSIEYEIKRQAEILEEGGKIIHETRGWDEPKGITVSQRSKEEAHDYRYFPEPDLLPLKPAELFDLEELKTSVPELPFDKRLRFIKEFDLKFGEVDSLVWDSEVAAYFEQVISELDGFQTTSGERREKRIKLAYNYFNSDLKGLMAANMMGLKDSKMDSHNFAYLIDFVDKNMISSAAAKSVLAEMFMSGVDPESVIKEKNLFQISDTKDLSVAIEKVIASNPEVVENYKKGKESVLQFLVGQVMKETKGRANPGVVLEQIKSLLTK
ncbi:MAG: Asp-tRNA(Asn)/Glu-tRNA(Gln) amidotransferase subunit GatB [bacterium]|nr:Asp-tRNA(Asn)/Glu-tRNA(Gln) amidotransferase subunit GatB [bacterium]